MFKKAVNYENREEMIKFLSEHFRYWTMNSWNRSSSYANNVKVYKLNIPKEYQDTLWEYVCGNLECPDIDFMIQDEIAEFKAKTGYDAGFNGRSGGYLVMYDTDWVDGKLVTYIGRSIDEDEDFADWEDSDLEERVKLVQRFDEMCDNIRDNIIYILSHYVVKEYTTTTVHTHRKLVEEGEE